MTLAGAASVPCVNDMAAAEAGLHARAHLGVVAAMTLATPLGSDAHAAVCGAREGLFGALRRWVFPVR